jgi:transcription factor TGA
MRDRCSMNRPRVNSLCMHAAAAAGYHHLAGAGAGAGRPPTLEIFPSWPMRRQQQLHSVKAPPFSPTPPMIIDASMLMHARIHLASPRLASPLVVCSAPLPRR